MGRSLLAFAVALALVGCGGGEPAERAEREEPTQDDAATAKAMLLSSGQLQRALIPLFSCVPDDPGCYRKAGPALASTAEEERNRFDSILEKTDNACLAEVGALYGDALDAYVEAGRAATAGKPSAADSAISRTTDAEIQATRKLMQCGFSEGATAEFTAAVREVNIKISRLGQEIYRCKDRACILSRARRLEDLAREGVALMDDYLARSREGDCLRPAMNGSRSGYRALERGAVALQDQKLELALKREQQAARLFADAQRTSAVCLEVVTR